MRRVSFAGIALAWMAGMLMAASPVVIAAGPPSEADVVKGTAERYRWKAYDSLRKSWRSAGSRWRVSSSHVRLSPYPRNSTVCQLTL
jgi:hypothetical protein